MPVNDVDVYGAFARKLSRLRALEDADVTAISQLPARLATEPRGSMLVREGDEVTRCCVLIEGFASRHKTARDGSRQIVSFHVPGGILDAQHLLLARADHCVQAVSDVVVAWIPKADLKAVAFSHPNIQEALWIDTLIDASVFRAWVLNVGRRDAKSRIAHMLCEFVTRCQAAGLGSPQRLRLPMTQIQIADATGLTPVHVNRMLRDLTGEGIISRSGGYLSILDWDRMQRVADFSPEYLHAAA